MPADRCRSQYRGVIVAARLSSLTFSSRQAACCSQGSQVRLVRRIAARAMAKPISCTYLPTRMKLPTAAVLLNPLRQQWPSSKVMRYEGLPTIISLRGMSTRFASFAGLVRAVLWHDKWRGTCGDGPSPRDAGLRLARHLVRDDPELSCSGAEIGNMLRYVASGPFPAATEWAPAARSSACIVHFVLMAIMAAVFMLHRAGQQPAACSTRRSGRHRLWPHHLCRHELDRRPAALRAPLPPKPLSIATQLFAHIVLVGIPFALIAARYLRRASCCLITSCEWFALSAISDLHDRLCLQRDSRR